jgi:putative NADH-flavin reductase
VGGDVLVTDAEGRSNLSNGDLGLVILDEIERPAHRRARFTAAY